MTAIPLPRATVRGDLVRVKPHLVPKMRGAYPLLTVDTLFEVIGETGAYEKRTLAVKPMTEGGDGLPSLLYAGAVKRALEGAEREKALREAGHDW